MSERNVPTPRFCEFCGSNYAKHNQATDAPCCDDRVNADHNRGIDPTDPTTCPTCGESDPYRCECPAYICDCGDGIVRGQSDSLDHAQEPEWYDAKTGRHYRHDQSHKDEITNRT